MYMPPDDEFVACVDREKSYGTPPLLLYYIMLWYNKTYSLVVVVLGSGLELGLVVVVVVSVVAALVF